MGNIMAIDLPTDTETPTPGQSLSPLPAPIGVVQRLMANHDVLLEIALFCPIQDQLRLSVTSTQWRQAVDSINRSRRVVDVRDTQEGFHDLARIISRAPRQSILEFIHRCPTEEAQRKNLTRSLERIREMCPKVDSLRNITVFDPRGDFVADRIEIYPSIQQEILKFHSLTCLELRNFGSVSTDLLHDALTRISSQLVELRFSSLLDADKAPEAFIEAFSRFESLEVLEICLQFDGAQDNGVFQFLLFLAKPEILREFHIRGLGKRGFNITTHEGLAAFLTKCKNLISLCIAPLHISNRPHSVCAVIPKLARLKHLDVELDGNRGFHFFKVCLEKLHSLESLKLLLNYEVDSERLGLPILEAVMKGCTSLKWLHAALSPREYRDPPRFFFPTCNGSHMDCKGAQSLEFFFFCTLDNLCADCVFSNFPQESIRSFYVSCSVANWDFIAGFQNLEHLDIEFPKLSHERITRSAFRAPLAYPKLRYLTLRRSHCVLPSSHSGFGRMAECIGSTLVGLKISQRIICSQAEAKYIDKLVAECRNLEYLNVFLELDVFQIDHHINPFRREITEGEKKAGFFDFLKTSYFSVTGIQQVLEKCPKGLSINYVTLTLLTSLEPWEEISDGRAMATERKAHHSHSRAIRNLLSGFYERSDFPSKRYVINGLTPR